ncbi:hypothetical protein D9M69_683410 [compost metagenome]
MFGTLYVTTSKPEPLSFGTGARDQERYLSLYSLIVVPFVDTARKLVRLWGRIHSPRAPQLPACTAQGQTSGLPGD